MSFLIKMILCLCVISSVKSEDQQVTFKNVTINWKSKTNQQTTTITSSNNLKQHLPDQYAERISVVVSGLVPVLYKDSVKDIDSLEKLTLSRVGLREINPGAFENLPNLIYLTVDKNNLREIKSGTFKNLTLSTLSLADNAISVLHPEAFQHSKIQHMTLSGNQLQQLSSHIFKDVSLKSLHFYKNAIQSIAPQAFDDVAGLLSLTLSGNKLEEIDPEAFNLPELTYLDLDFNSVALLRPGDLKNMPQLQTLELVGNQLTHIPEGIFNHTKISHLKLNFNKITTIESGAFDDMTHLSVLHIDHNYLAFWNNNWLHNSAQVAYVLAGWNSIEEIPDEAFRNYPKVYSIDLQNNKISKIAPNAFAKLESVVNFGLSDNQIGQWEETLLGEAHVGTLDLSDNKLKCIDGDLEEVFRKVDFVHLSGNPWDETCAKKISSFIASKES